MNEIIKGTIIVSVGSTVACNGFNATLEQITSEDLSVIEKVGAGFAGVVGSVAMTYCAVVATEFVLDKGEKIYNRIKSRFGKH